MNSLESTSKTQFQRTSSVKQTSGSAVIANPGPMSSTELEALSEQMRQNLIRNVAEAQSRPAGDPADWEI